MTRVNVSVAPGQRKSFTAESSCLRRLRSGKVVTFEYPDQRFVIEKRWPGLSGTSDKVDGWREPTIFRGAISKITSYPFSYDCAQLSSRPIISHAGDSFPPSFDAIDFGVSGAGYPIGPNYADRAITECLANSDKSEFQVGTAVGELSQTVFALGRSLHELRRYMDSAYKFLTRNVYRRHHVQRVLRASATPEGRKVIRRSMSKEAASRWLEYQYGWKPLMSDIYGLAGLIDEQMKSRKFRITAKSNPSTRTSPSRVLNPDDSKIEWVKQEHTAFCGAFCRMDWEVTNAVARTFNRMGLLNPLSIAWELIPFSFVLDWILPVGTYLQALTAGWGLKYLGGSVTRWSTYETMVWWTAFPLVKGSPIHYKTETLAWFRYPVSDLRPRLYVRNPITTVTRTANALALLTQVLSRKG